MIAHSAKTLFASLKPVFKFANLFEKASYNSLGSIDQTTKINIRGKYRRIHSFDFELAPLYIQHLYNNPFDERYAITLLKFIRESSTSDRKPTEGEKKSVRELVDFLLLEENLCKLKSFSSFRELLFVCDFEGYLRKDTQRLKLLCRYALLVYEYEITHRRINIDGLVTIAVLLSMQNLNYLRTFITKDLEEYEMQPQNYGFKMLPSQLFANIFGACNSFRLCEAIEVIAKSCGPDHKFIPLAISKLKELFWSLRLEELKKLQQVKNSIPGLGVHLDSLMEKLQLKVKIDQETPDVNYNDLKLAPLHTQAEPKKLLKRINKPMDTQKTPKN